MISRIVNVFGKDINVSYVKDRFITEVMERHEYRRLFENITVVDIGANIGTFSFWIYPFAGHIYSIEPTDCYSAMVETVKVNRLDKIKTFNFAISNGTGKRFISGEFEEGYGGEWCLDRAGGNFRKEVQTYSLNQFMNMEGIKYIDILKLDTEGTEWEILSAGDFPKDKIHTIIGEAHSTGYPQVLEQLEKLGFTIVTGLHNFLAKRI